MPQVIIQTSVAPTEYPAGISLGQYRFRLSNGALPAATLYVDPPPPVVGDAVVGAAITVA